ncbi:MAG: hypothetical protein LBH06_05500 [Rikenellaceae bacterium]|jgi:hypothetical protein|nr:hypothetical protein [Rikenellaceae bacterium]
MWQALVGSVLSRTSRVKLGRPYRVLRHRYEGGSGDSFFILVAFGTPDCPDGVAYWVKAADLSPVDNRFGLYESVVETGKGGLISRPVGIESYSARGLRSAVTTTRICSTARSLKTGFGSIPS